MSWETAATFDNAVAAEMAKNYLDEHGIRTMLTDQETVATSWQWSQAIGGIKLLVPDEDVEQAQELLENRPDRLRGDATEPIDAGAVAVSHEVARNVVDPGPDDEILETEADRTADHALKSMVFGLLAFPLQFYAIYLLLQLPQAAGPLQPQYRRKVPLALAMCLPLWALIGVPLVMLIAAMSDPRAPRWHVEVFDVDAHTLVIDLPNSEERQAAVLTIGPETLRGQSYDTNQLSQTFAVLFWPVRGDRLGDRMLQDYVNARIESLKGKPAATSGLEHGKFEGVEYRTEHVDGHGRRRQVRGQAFAVGDQIVEVATSGYDDACDNTLSRRFFRSLRIK